MFFGPSNSISSSREGKKLLVFGILFVLAIGIYLYVNVKTSLGGSDGEVPGVQQRAPGEPETENAPLALPGDSDEKPAPEPVVPADPDIDMSVFDDNEIHDRRQTIERPYLFKLLTMIKDTPAAELRTRAVTAKFNDFFSRPEEWRGKVLHIEGMIRKIVKRRTETLPEGIDVLYEAQITDNDAYWYYVFIIGDPGFKEDDLVSFDGAFMKVHAYKTIRGTLLYAPLVVCKGFEKVVLPPWRPYHTIGWAVLVVILVGGAAAVFIAQSQKSDSDAVSRKVEQKRLDRARAWAESKKHPGDKPPPDTEEKSGDDSETPGEE